MATVLILFATLFGHLALAYPPTIFEHSSFEHHDDHQYAHAPIPYHFEYAVNDPHTHDVKSHHESNDGHGNVKGSYSLLEADGSTRVVTYTADHEHGFNAEVKKIEAPAHHEFDVTNYHEPTHSTYKPSSHFHSY
ncbi:PREDICTED: cuticle protein 18.6, isoform A-like [Diuraphis noxia]|uniref:cuticle protein 18.6, isoform A-like n=1 Tax=Diuraphis noxia TaxID=143948 RepID=UPI0007639984|nr:PREDICTED: cuticle protein 18.6, isoform A-like [Diuraphis noxia]